MENAVNPMPVYRGETVHVQRYCEFIDLFTKFAITMYLSVGDKVESWEFECSDHGKERIIFWKAGSGAITPTDVMAAQTCLMAALVAAHQKDSQKAVDGLEQLKGLVSAEEVAKVLHITEGALRVRVHRGNFPAPFKKIGKKCYWTREQLAEVAGARS